jgi:hypothetical protein
MVTTREASSNPMMRVKHARHTIKSEPIKLEMLHEEPQIREQEPQYLVMSIIEQTTAKGQDKVYMSDLHYDFKNLGEIEPYLNAPVP